jgi:hypothetical protein
MTTMQAGADELVLSRDEIIDLMDGLAKERRHMSGAELVHLYRNGRLEAPGEVMDILCLADLLADNDPFFW